MSEHTPSIPAEVYFFGTCLIDVFYPDAGISAIELIEREGIKVIFPRNKPAVDSLPTTQAITMKPSKWPPRRSHFSPDLFRWLFLPHPVQR